MSRVSHVQSQHGFVHAPCSRTHQHHDFKVFQLQHSRLKTSHLSQIHGSCAGKREVGLHWRRPWCLALYRLQFWTCRQPQIKQAGQASHPALVYPSQSDDREMRGSKYTHTLAFVISTLPLQMYVTLMAERKASLSKGTWTCLPPNEELNVRKFRTLPPCVTRISAGQYHLQQDVTMTELA
jgi:hypothetical protein